VESPFKLCTNVRHFPAHLRSRSARTLWLALGILICFSTSAASPPDSPRFRLNGTGTLQLDQSVQKSGNVKLKAYLSPTDAAISASPPVQEGGGFALMASFAAASLVCYNDTIFRDDFDGDGF
jgi:hypothetical protein